MEGKRGEFEAIKITIYGGTIPKWYLHFPILQSSYKQKYRVREYLISPGGKEVYFEGKWLLLSAVIMQVINCWVTLCLRHMGDIFKVRSRGVKREGRAMEMKCQLHYKTTNPKQESKHSRKYLPRLWNIQILPCSKIVHIATKGFEFMRVPF